MLATKPVTRARTITIRKMRRKNRPQSLKPGNKIYYKTVQEHQHGHSIQNQQHN
jgi:hypothetical protein